MSAPPLLEVRGLRIGIPAAAGELVAVSGLDLELARGEILGLVGESGSGKSLSMLAVMGLLPRVSRRRSRISTISAWMVTSSAVVGSSAISRSGSFAMAIAITTRWRMPPDSSCGYCSRRRSGIGIATRRKSSTARSRRSRAVSRG